MDQALLKEFFEFKRFKESIQNSSVADPQSTDTRRKNQWTHEDDKALLDGVAEFGFKWTKIQKKYPFLANKGAVAALRHRYMVVKEQLNEGTIKCPKCNTKITEKVFLGCTCGVDNDQLLASLIDNTGWIRAGKHGITRRLDSVTLKNLFDVESSNVPTHKVFLQDKWVSLDELKHHIDIFRDAKSSDSIFDEPYVTKTLHREIGILCGTLVDENFFYQKHVCYRVGEMICKCKVPCNLRHMWNSMAGLPCYSPFSPLGIKPRYRNPETCPDIDYFSGTINDKDYFEKVLQRNKKLKPKTKLTYLESLKWLRDNGFFDFETIVPHEFVKHCQLLCETSQNTLLVRLAIIPIIFSNLRDDELFDLYGPRGKEVRRGFYNEIGKLQHEHVQREDNQMTEREEKNWMDFDVLEAKLIEYLTKKGNPPNETSAAGVVIAALHILQSPIRGYHSVMISGYNPDTDNYLVVGDTPETSYFVFNNFKTDKTFGPTRLVVKEAVYGMLKEIVSRKQTKYLFTVAGKPDEPMTVKVYSQYLGNFIEKLTGKRIASQMIRKMYVSFVRRNELTAEQNRELSRTLQHSEKMSRGVYRVIKKS